MYSQYFVVKVMLIFGDAEVDGFVCNGGQHWSDTSNPIRTCHDLELLASGRWTPDAADTLVAGCHCPQDMYLSHAGQCVVAEECSCYDEASDSVVPPGRTLRRDCSIWYDSKHVHGFL